MRVRWRGVQATEIPFSISLALSLSPKIPSLTSQRVSCWKMTKSARGRRGLLSRQFRSTPYPVPPYSSEVLEKEVGPKITTLALEDWKDTTCSVCMEFPHNAVLLLCSSHDKGCRPYMCGTSHRHSNCLSQFKKAYTKPNGVLALPVWLGNENSEVKEIACPLCRGQVKGWTVVEPAREYLNDKKRSCMQDKCSFMGTYKELRKHVKSEHPSARPHEVDPVLEQKWRALERERERDDVISTIMSSIPGSVVRGDYVIEMDDSDDDSDDEANDVSVRVLEGGGLGINRRILYFF